METSGRDKGGIWEKMGKLEGLFFVDNAVLMQRRWRMSKKGPTRIGIGGDGDQIMAAHVRDISEVGVKWANPACRCVKQSRVAACTFLCVNAVTLSLPDLLGRASSLGVEFFIRKKERIP